MSNESERSCRSTCEAVSLHASLPTKDIEWLTEYEVNFSNRMIATFYQAQLRLLNPAKD
jgi:hypothetical protein